MTVAWPVVTALCLHIKVKFLLVGFVSRLILAPFSVSGTAVLNRASPGYPPDSTLISLNVGVALLPKPTFYRLPF